MDEERVVQEMISPNSALRGVGDALRSTFVETIDDLFRDLICRLDEIDEPVCC